MDEPGSRWTAAATSLLDAQRSRVPVAPLTTRAAGLTLQDAYRIQVAGVALRVGDGARVVGHKVGVTSAAMQEQMGVDEPDSGVLFEDMVLPGGSELDRADFLLPRVEAEIAFRLGSDLAGPDVTLAAAKAAVSEVFLALEVIDTRYDTSWRIALADSVADNASCARVVTGDMVCLDPAWDLAAEQARVERRQQRFADAYIELLEVLGHFGQWAQTVRPVADFGEPQHPLPAPEQQARVRTLVAAYGSPEVKDLYENYQKVIGSVQTVDRKIGLAMQPQQVGTDLAKSEPDLWDKLHQLRLAEREARSRLGTQVSLELSS
jgi:2-keto-4-pentenoate hydratase